MTDQPRNPSSNYYYCFCELAPLFALNLLTDDERQWVEQQILDCPELAEELEQYQLGVTAVPYGADLAPLSGAVKDRLFAGLGLVIPDKPEPESESIERCWPFMALRSNELQWVPHFFPKAKYAILHADPVTRECVGLLQAEAGLEYPSHRHAGTEEIYMLSGDLKLEGTTYYAGDYIRSAPGSTHAPAHSVDGCMFFFRSSMDDEYLN
jgi:hypothetical protein